MDLQELIKQCLRGDPSAQRLLFEKFVTPMGRLCVRYLKDRDAAQDILMDGFVKVFNKLKHFEYQGDHSLEMWMRRIMINECLMKLRKNRARFFMDVTEMTLISDKITDEHISAEEILGMINRLPVGYRTVFNLYGIDGYSHKEIADLLSITESASRSQLTHARAMLKELLHKHGWK